MLVKATLEGIINRQSHGQFSPKRCAKYPTVELGLHQTNGGLRERNVISFGNERGGISDQVCGEVTNFRILTQSLIVNINKEEPGKGLIFPLQHRLNRGLHGFTLRVHDCQGLEPLRIAAEPAITEITKRLGILGHTVHHHIVILAGGVIPAGVVLIAINDLIEVVKCS